MDLGGRIIIVFLIALISVHLLGLKEPLYDFMKTVLAMPELGHGKDQFLFHMAKICILIIAIVGVLKILSRGKED